MSRRPAKKRLSPSLRAIRAGGAIASLALGVGMSAVGCAGSATGQDAGPSQATLVSVGVRFTHREPAARGPSVPTVTAQGQFARFRADQAERATALLGLSADGAIAVGSCRLVDGQSELDRALAGEISADVQLLDAGRILVHGPVDAMVLVPRHYPPLTTEVGGVFYDAAEAPQLTPVFGGSYALAGQGGEEVGPFAAEVTLPKSFPLLEAPVLAPGGELELRWSEPEEPTGEPLSVAIAWLGRGTSGGAREVHCRVRDDGHFTVGRELLAGLTPASVGDAEVTLTRVRRSSFVAPGVGAGEATLGLAEVAAVQVFQGTP